MQYNRDDPAKRGKWPEEKAYAAVYTKDSFDRADLKKNLRENCCVSNTTAVFAGSEIVLNTILDDDDGTVYATLQADENGSIELLQEIAERLDVMTELD